MAVGEIDKVIDTPVVEETEPKFQYPGMPTTCDGAEAVVWVETRVCQVHSPQLPHYDERSFVRSVCPLCTM